MKVIHKIKKSCLDKAFFWVILNIVLTKAVFAFPGETGGDGSTLENPLSANTFGELINNIAKTVAKIGIPVAAMFIIYSGLLFVTARGSEEQLKKAKVTFTWAMIGTAILLGASVIASAISGTIQGF